MYTGTRSETNHGGKLPKKTVVNMPKAGNNSNATAAENSGLAGTNHAKIVNAVAGKYDKVIAGAGMKRNEVAGTYLKKSEVVVARIDNSSFAGAVSGFSAIAGTCCKIIKNTGPEMKNNNTLGADCVASMAAGAGTRNQKAAGTSFIASKVAGANFNTLQTCGSFSIPTLFTSRIYSVCRIA